MLLFVSLFFALPFQAFAANFTISGRAIDTLSNLVINAQITVTDIHSKQVVAKTTTGLDGYYVITVPQGAYDITLIPQTQSGLATITANDLVITSNTQHNFTLPIPVPTAANNSGKVNNGTPITPGLGQVALPSGSKLLKATHPLVYGTSLPTNPTPFIIAGVIILFALTGGGVWYWNYYEKHKSLYYNFKDSSPKEKI